jgi:hypothetical protein
MKSSQTLMWAEIWPFLLVASQMQLSFITDTVGTHTLDVVVNDATKPLRLIIAKASTVVLDNISVKEVIFDRATDPLVLFNHPTNVPRIEYDANGNRRGLLIEEARTNLVPYSEDLSNAAWDNIRAHCRIRRCWP